METVYVRTEGRLIIDGFSIPVYQLENGEYAASQTAVYEYFTGKSAKTGARYPLSISSIRRYIPKSMLKAPEFAVYLDGKNVKLFLAEEWLGLCKAVIHAGFNNDLNVQWHKAHIKAQVLLLAFAESGIHKTLNKAIRQNPVMSAEQFKLCLLHILEYKPVSGK